VFWCRRVSVVGCRSCGAVRLPGRGYWGFADDCSPHGALHGAEYRVRVAEAHFGLGWMDVDIYIFSKHLQQQECDWVTVDRKQRMISLDDGVRHSHILDPAPVDKEGDVASTGAMGCGGPHVTTHTQGFLRRPFWCNFQQTSAKFQSVDLL